jgi:DNA (cytosine-5)-methyltransferase 1
MTSLTFIDIFAGIGGIRLGFEANGCQCVFSSEWDKFAQKTYLANFGETPAGDITKIDAKEIPNFDILAAGFPCQPFSSIGKREGFANKTQGTLFFEIARIIKDKNPPVVFLENVPGLTTHDEGKTFETVLGALNELGYKVYHKILDSVDFGVPQFRKRIYMVAFNRAYFGGDEKISFNFPKPKKKRTGVGQFVETGVKGYCITKHLQETYIFKKNDGRPLIIDPSYDKPVKTFVSTYYKIQRLTGTFVKDGETGLRLLTTNECKAIMGFPPDYRIPVSRMQMYRQIGNSVAVPVIKEIAEEIVKTLQRKTGKELGQYSLKPFLGS